MNEGKGTPKGAVKEMWAIKKEILDKQFAKKTYLTELESHLSSIRFRRNIEAMHPIDLLLDKKTGKPDEILGPQTGFDPFNLREDQKNNANLPTELRRILNDAEPEMQNLFQPIFDETSRQEYIDTHELKTQLFEAKWKWYVETKMSQLHGTTKELAEERSYAEEYDAWLSNRVEFMYDFLDFDTERHRIRNKFLQEMHKKTTLKDIGEKLDEFIFSSKAAVAETWDLGRHVLEQPLSPQKDKDEGDYDWYANIVKSFDPQRPNWLDDESQIDDLASGETYFAKEVMKQIKFNDSMRDYSIGQLTAEEHQEIALFHTMRQDPFYKHHMRTHLSKFADEVNNTGLSTSSPAYINPDDFTKFDRINLFDFRRTLPQKLREPKLDNKGRAWGFGKRKASQAQVSVWAGSGRIMVNGRPFIQYFS